MRHNHTMSASFKSLTPAKAKTFLKLLSEKEENHPFAETSKFLIQELGFTDGWARIDAEDYKEAPFVKRGYFLKDDNVRPFHYSNVPLNDNFADMNIAIDDANVIDYLKLYCDLWVSNGETLKPVFDFDDIPWQDEISPMMRKSLDRDLHDYPKLGALDDGYLVKMLCLFRQSLMAVTFEVTPLGIVSIKDRTVLIEDLPIKNLP